MDFTGIETATRVGGGKYFEEGEYEAELLEFREHDGHNGQCLVTTWEIIDSSNPTLGPGCEAAYILKPSKNYGDAKKAHANFVAEVKEVALALSGAPDPTTGKRIEVAPEHITPDVIRTILHPSQPMAGRRVHISATKKLTRAGTYWTRVTVSPSDPERTERARAAALAMPATAAAPAPARAVAPAAPPSPPAPPAPPPAPRPAPPVNVEAAAAAAGWAIHPDNPAFWYRGTTVVAREQLAAQL